MGRLLFEEGSWLNEHGAALLAGLGVFGLVPFVGSLILLPIIVSRMPADYLVRPVEPWSARSRSQVLLGVGRNALGLLLFLGGVLMLVLPGQGLLTMAIGLFLMDFPGKRHLQAWSLARPPIRRGIAWLRRKAGQQPLEFPTHEA